MSHIQDRELDNKSAIQLIKDQTLDNTHCEVKFQLDLYGGVINYQDLMHYLSIAFQGGDNEAQILAEFYSHSQRAKESEEVFANELQLLAHKVIGKTPKFHKNLDSTLKQCYVSQLYDCNSTSIAKTLLKQMLEVSFTEFWNELVRVHGTHQHAVIKVATKAMSVSSLEVKDQGEVVQSKSKAKQNKKISSQSSQIKDLQAKLDQAVAENIQLKDLLSPASLELFFSNALQASGHSSKASRPSSTGYQSKPFQGKHHPSQCTPGRDGKTNPEESCCYCKDTGHNIGNCV